MPMQPGMERTAVHHQRFARFFGLEKTLGSVVVDPTVSLLHFALSERRAPSRSFTVSPMQESMKAETRTKAGGTADILRAC